MSLTEMAIAGFVGWILIALFSVAVLSTWFNGIKKNIKKSNTKTWESSTEYDDLANDQEFMRDLENELGD